MGRDAPFAKKGEGHNATFLGKTSTLVVFKVKSGVFPVHSLLEFSTKRFVKAKRLKLPVIDRDLRRTMTHSVATTRRAALLGLGAALCTPALAQARASYRRTLDLRNDRTGDRFTGTYFGDGYYEPEAMAELDHLMRDFHADESIMMDVRLYDIFAALQDTTDTTEPLVITSGYRSRKTNDRLRKTNRWAAKNSLHVPGMAADLKITGVGSDRLVGIAKSLKMGGVGSYRGASFIHVDVGDVRSWRR